MNLTNIDPVSGPPTWFLRYVLFVLTLVISSLAIALIATVYSLVVNGVK